MDRNKKVLAVVGMAGAGKSDVASFLKQKGLSVIRFGEETDNGLRQKGLPLTEENERKYRVDLRKHLGMAAYALKAKKRIDEELAKSDTVILDGLYSWEEYQYLKECYPQLVVIVVFADRTLRYDRLHKRPMRPLSFDQAESRDVTEIEELKKAGPIAMADYILENNGTQAELAKKTDALLQRLGVV